jgi:hypothetical protein
MSAPMLVHTLGGSMTKIKLLALLLPGLFLVSSAAYARHHNYSNYNNGNYNNMLNSGVLNNGLLNGIGNGMTGRRHRHHHRQWH